MAKKAVDAASIASEVKELAGQAGDSSEEIKLKLECIKNNKEGAVNVIQGISRIIVEANDITESIASTVEEQSITAKSIANNAGQVFLASDERTLKEFPQHQKKVQGMPHLFSLCHQN